MTRSGFVSVYFAASDVVSVEFLSDPVFDFKSSVMRRGPVYVEVWAIGDGMAMGF